MKDDSSRNGPDDSSFLKGSTFHLSMSSVSHGLSFLCVEGIFGDYLEPGFVFQWAGILLTLAT